MNYKSNGFFAIVATTLVLPSSLAEQVSIQAYVSGLAPQNSRYNTAKITAGYSNCPSPIGASFFIDNTCGPPLTTPGYYDLTGNYDHERIDGYRGDIPVLTTCNPRMATGPAVSTGACPTTYIGYNSVLPVQQSFAVSSGQAVPWWQTVPAQSPGVASAQLSLDAPFSMPITVFPGLRTPSTPTLGATQITAPGPNNNAGSNNIAAAQVTTTTTTTTPASAPFFFRVFPTASTVVVQPVPSPPASTPYLSPFFTSATSSSSNIAAAQITPTTTTTTTTAFPRCASPTGCFPGAGRTTTTTSASSSFSRRSGGSMSSMMMSQRGRSSVTYPELVASSSSRPATQGVFATTTVAALLLLLVWSGGNLLGL